MQQKDSYFYIDEYGIVHSDHPGEDGLIFNRDKFMTGVAVMEKRRLAEQESGSAPSWLERSFLGRSAESIGTWEDYLGWLNTNSVGETEEVQHSLIRMAKEQIARMKANDPTAESDSSMREAAETASAPADEQKDRFLSADEIVRDYIESLRRFPDALEKWMNAKREDVRMWHWGAGMWIRNHYRL